MRIPGYSFDAVGSYIVDGVIASVDIELEDFDGDARFAQLPRKFGFVVTVWNPAAPDFVREIHWNTEEERQHHPYVGRIVYRKATEYERRDGEWQHSHRHRDKAAR